MAKPFDAATKRLVESDPQAWLTYLGLPGRAIGLLSTDLTTVTADADSAIEVGADPPYLLHLELQSTYETDLDERLLRYTTLIFCRHLQPVQSVVVLLRPEADGPGITGTAGFAVNGGAGSLAFRGMVVRVWEKTPEEVLSGGLATLPLAPLADLDAGELPRVIERMEERIVREAAGGEAGILWTATYLLMGLRFRREVIAHVLRGVRGMKESVTYQEILEEGAAIGEARGEARGEIKEARSLLLRLGGKRLGPPSAAAREAVTAITSLERLEALAERLLEVETWDELLA